MTMQCRGSIAQHIFSLWEAPMLERAMSAKAFKKKFFHGVEKKRHTKSVLKLERGHLPAFFVFVGSGYLHHVSAAYLVNYDSYDVHLMKSTVPRIDALCYYYGKAFVIFAEVIAEDKENESGEIAFTRIEIRFEYKLQVSGRFEIDWNSLHHNTWIDESLSSYCTLKTTWIISGQTKQIPFMAASTLRSLPYSFSW